jgi:hypothetical protein
MELAIVCIACFVFLAPLKFVVLLHFSLNLHHLIFIEDTFSSEGHVTRWLPERSLGMNTEERKFFQSLCTQIMGVTGAQGFRGCEFIFVNMDNDTTYLLHAGQFRNFLREQDPITCHITSK